MTECLTCGKDTVVEVASGSSSTWGFWCLKCNSKWLVKSGRRESIDTLWHKIE